MENLLVFVVAFTFIFIAYLVMYIIKRKTGKLKEMKEFDYLISKYHLNRKVFDYNSVGLVIILVNTLIIAVTGTLCTMVDLSYIWQIVIGFALLMVFIYIGYGVMGKILVMRDQKKAKEKKKL